MLLMAAGRAPFIEIWPQAQWQRWLANLAMPVAISLVVFAVGVANPFSFGGKVAGFDPDRPGIIGLTRHPLMLAFAIWAGAHLLVNGDLPSFILFGGLLAWAHVEMRLINRTPWTPPAGPFPVRKEIMAAVGAVLVTAAVGMIHGWLGPWPFGG